MFVLDRGCPPRATASVLGVAEPTEQNEPTRPTEVIGDAPGERGPRFPMRIWGYDRRSADARIGELEEQVRELQEATRTAAGAPELVGVAEKVEEILRAAQEAAATATNEATDRATELRRESEEAAARLKNDSQEAAAGLKNESQRAAERIRNEADEYAERIRADADREAEEASSRSAEEAGAMLEKAESEAAEVLREANVERRRIERSIDELRERRRGVIESIERLKGELSEMVGQAELGTAQFAALDRDGEATDLLAGTEEPPTDVVIDPETEERAIRTEDL